jgi:DNA-binding NtrC family response regulator
MADRMRARGLDVSTTTSATDALAMIEKKPYDAIIMDLMMPELEGMEALRALKNKKQELQIILLTGYVTLEQVIKAMRLGAMDIIEKPADLEVLTEKIKKAHEKKNMILAENQAKAKFKKKARTIPKGGLTMQTRILIIDDEEEFVQTLAERLTVRNYDVTTSLSGEDAVGKMKHYNYDVVILDVQMPGMDGVEALREIKKLKPLTEVIMLTGHGTVESAIEGMKLGALDYLMKPCETEELVSKIDKAYDRKAEHEERIRAAKVQNIVSSPRSVLEE